MAFPHICEGGIVSVCVCVCVCVCVNIQEVLFGYNTYFRVTDQLSPSMKHFWETAFHYSLQTVEVHFAPCAAVRLSCEPTFS